MGKSLYAIKKSSAQKTLKINDIDASGIHQAFCAVYFGQEFYFVSLPIGLVCKNPSIWFLEQHHLWSGQAIETSKPQAFAGETQGESVRKSREEDLST